MRLDDLFTILSWHTENTINRHWIIVISVAISVFPPEKRSRYNVRDEERKRVVHRGTNYIGSVSVVDSHGSTSSARRKTIVEPVVLHHAGTTP